jgi:hypothetical protein
MLGMPISRNVLATTEETVATVAVLPALTTMAALYRVVGMFGYYQNFIRNFFHVAKPLTDLKKVGKLTPGAKILWTEECQTALAELKSRL